MVQEQKDILLRDLCARLPYGIKVQVAPVPSKEYEHITFNAKIVYIDINYIGVLSDWNFVFQQDITEVKPYLFPLSSMTEEQSKTYHELVSGMFGTSTLINFEVLEDFFHKNHLDYRGLIPMRLAIDATGLNVY